MALAGLPALPDSSIPTLRTRLAECAMEYAEKATSAATREAYRSDLASFTAWADGLGLPTLPTTPEVLALYITHLAEIGRRVATIQRALSAINKAHTTKRLSAISTKQEPLASVWKGVRRVLGVAQTQKQPVLTADLRAIMAELPPTLRGRRDKAILLLGFAGAFRRSELVGLNVEDLTVSPLGLTVQLRKSKTDQEGAGKPVGIMRGASAKTCPIRALGDWLKASGIESGPVFRRVNRGDKLGTGRLSGESVAQIVKAAMASLGRDPAEFGGHSLRAGLATNAAAEGSEERHIMKQTRHKTVTMVRRYIRDGGLFRDNVSGQVGL